MSSNQTPPRGNTTRLEEIRHRKQQRTLRIIALLVVLLAAIFIIINTIIDISYLYLDPRIRKAQGGL